MYIYIHANIHTATWFERKAGVDDEDMESITLLSVGVLASEEGHEASFTLLFTDSVMTALLCLVSLSFLCLVPFSFLSLVSLERLPPLPDPVSCARST